MGFTGAKVLVSGAGIMGLSIALELRSRGHDVTVVDTRRAMRQATWAAAGMLAAEDPHNPAALLPFARLSASLYPEYLGRVEAVSGESVPFQTEAVVEYLPGGQRVRRPERSVDPRQLATALLVAVRRSGVVLHEDAGELDVAATQDGVAVGMARGGTLKADALVQATGAWFQGGVRIKPCKGQMLRVQMRAEAPVTEVHRRADVYIVPRTRGPQAGTAVIGATVEDAGFDVSTRQEDLDHLRRLAGELLPDFGLAAQTPMVEAWAGLRPETPDGLPLLGALAGRPREFVATGHFRNGILLAPATAVALADRIEGRPDRVDLTPYAPERFG